MLAVHSPAILKMVLLVEEGIEKFFSLFLLTSAPFLFPGDRRGTAVHSISADPSRFALSQSTFFFFSFSSLLSLV